MAKKQDERPEGWQLTESEVMKRLGELGWVPDEGGDLEETVAAYQAWWGLKPDAVVGNVTARHLLHGPEEGFRFCGLPEFIVGDPRTMKWRRSIANDLTWHVNGSFRGLSSSESKEACEWCWRTWASVCGIRPRYVSNSRSANVLINAAGRIDGNGSVLAWSKLPNINMPDGTQLDQLYDLEAWEFRPQGGRPSNGRINLAAVLAHEVGHMLGVPHSSGRALMAPTYNWQVHVPQPDDIQNVQARYGPSLDDPVDPPPVDPPPGDVTEIPLGGGLALHVPAKAGDYASLGPVSGGGALALPVPGR